MTHTARFLFYIAFTESFARSANSASPSCDFFPILWHPKKGALAGGLAVYLFHSGRHRRREVTVAPEREKKKWADPAFYRWQVAFSISPFERFARVVLKLLPVFLCGRPAEGLESGRRGNASPDEEGGPLAAVLFNQALGRTRTTGLVASSF